MDLNSVNLPVSGSKRSAPSGADDQILPLPSKSTVVAPPVGDIPCVCAAKPFAAGTLNSLTSPVLLVILPIVTCLLGMLEVNQTFWSRSSQASCTPQPGISTEGVPSDQSLPSFCT